jgi:mannitol/fructose-specific phosphotransferase system IIA component (Ntr-type)
MNLSDIISSNSIRLDAKVGSKKEMLQLIASLAMNNIKSKSIKEKQIFKALEKREEQCSTGFGRNFAVPHCRIKGLEEFVVGIVTAPQGIEFESYDDEPAKVFVFIIAPEDRQKEHLLILSNITKFLKKDDTLIKILSAKNESDLKESFIRHTNIQTTYSPTKDSFLFTLIVQDEDRFNDVLDVFAEIEDCTATVIEAKNASEYLYALPLFSSFWTTNKNTFCRIITGIVKKSSYNEAISLFNEIINSLDDKTGILLTVQELMYHSGSLDV